MQGHEHVVRDLLAHGATASMVDNDGYTPLEVALVRNNVSLTEVFYHDGTVFTKRQMLLFSVLKRQSLVVKCEYPSSNRRMQF